MSKPIPMRPRSYSDNYRTGEGDYRGKNFRSDGPYTYGGNYQPGPSTPSGYRQNPPSAPNSSFQRGNASDWSKTAPSAYRDYKSYKKTSSETTAARKTYRQSSGTDQKSLGEVLRLSNTEAAGRQGHLQKYPRALPNPASYRDHEKRISEVRNTASKSRSGLSMLFKKEARKAAKASSQQSSS